MVKFWKRNLADKTSVKQQQRAIWKRLFSPIGLQFSKVFVNMNIHKAQQPNISIFLQREMCCFLTNS